MKPFAKVSQVKVGTKLKADGGFTCLDEGEVCEVCADEDGLYIKCKEGRHGLGGQLASELDTDIDPADDEYVGLYVA